MIEDETVILDADDDVRYQRSRMRFDRIRVLEDETAVLVAAPPPIGSYGQVSFREFEDTVFFEEDGGDFGLRKETILRRLKTRNCVGGDDENNCAVCQDNLRGKDCCGMVGVLPCRHEFHVGCIVEWLQRKNTCPLCNATAVIVAGEEGHGRGQNSLYH
ncbi:probable E3 ubiquitin-protein ligase RHG1A [Andrographis paniculata]|uniref:probable E3 ubiquitin-protein ligase RHG1A n=1 Tax=Andrographis paniculata TaxID=175694 RepID=UPI0021E940C7|nr:probable E3 ubiquitin-protein ligase RHG1A [Andrographis paniculata]